MASLNNPVFKVVVITRTQKYVEFPHNYRFDDVG
mgnify:CR=1 FL=1